MIVLFFSSNNDLFARNSNLLSVLGVYGHHLLQRLENLDAEVLLLLLQKLRRVSDQSSIEKKVQAGYL